MHWTQVDPTRARLSAIVIVVIGLTVCGRSAGPPKDSFRDRLGAHGPRWVALGVNFYRSPQVPWKN